MELQTILVASIKINKLFNLLMTGQLKRPGSINGGGSSTSYFPTPSYSGTSLVGALNAIGVDSSFDNREKIAAANGITDYTGSADQNNKLFNLLMTGQLKRPGSMDSDNGSGDTGDGLTEIGHVSGLKVRKILPPTNKYDIKCPYPMDPTYITVHNTANQASAINEISYMHNNSNEVSFHYAVDDIEAIQGLPLNRNGWHSGDGSQGTGNRKSIAVEICYSRYGGEKFDKAEKNAAKLIAALMEQFDIPIDRVRKHQDWSGKYCPHRTLDAGWDRFVDMIMQEVRYRQILKFASENGLFTGTNVALEDFNKRVKLLEIPGTVPGRPNLIVYGEVGLHSTISFIDITLGQNQTTEANSNRASAQAGLEVTDDIRDADADIVESAVNQAIRMAVSMNFGDVASPVWNMWEQGTVDDTQATRDEKLSRAGVVFTPQYFKREYQLQDGDIDETPPSERQKNMLPLSFAEAIDADIQAQQALDDALDILMNGGALNGTLEPVLAPLFKRVEDGVNPSELLGELAELYPQMNAEDLQERLARIMFVATVWGRLHERDNG